MQQRLNVAGDNKESVVVAPPSHQGALCNRTYDHRKCPVTASVTCARVISDVTRSFEMITSRCDVTVGNFEK